MERKVTITQSDDDSIRIKAEGVTGAAELLGLIRLGEWQLFEIWQDSLVTESTIENS